MEYKEFLDYIQSSMSQIIGKEKKVKVLKVLKTNNVSYDALTITDNNYNVSPTIYLNQFYIDYQNNKPLGEIVNEIYAFYEEHAKNIEIDTEIFTNFEKARKKVAFRVINAEKNTVLLEDCPHIRKLDLAIVFYCMINNDYLGSATSIIHYNHLELWGISVEELISAATKNTPVLLKPMIQDMNDLIFEMFKDDLQRQQMDGILPLDLPIEDDLRHAMESAKKEYSLEMFVLTNSQKQYGAACIFYENILKDFSDKFKTDIYILPSSIHEVILIPVSKEMTIEELNQMVVEVNTNEVENCEVLSDHVYIYKRNNNEIIM